MQEGEMASSVMFSSYEYKVSLPICKKRGVNRLKQSKYYDPSSSTNKIGTSQKRRRRRNPDRKSLRISYLQVIKVQKLYDKNKNKNPIFGFRIVESVKDEKMKGYVTYPPNVM